MAVTVEVARGPAVDGTLPLVSVRSGRRAVGRVPLEVANLPPNWAWAASFRVLAALIRWLTATPSVTVRLPLTQSEFDRWIWLQKTQRRTPAMIVGSLAAGVAFGRFPYLLVLGIVIALFSIAAGAVVGWAIPRYLPAVRVTQGADTVVLIGVHPEFATAALREARP